MRQSIPCATQKPTGLILDEFSTYADRDDLAALISTLDTVPKTSYMLREDGQVFVHQKLIELVKESTKKTSTVPCAEIVNSLLPDAFISEF